MNKAIRKISFLIFFLILANIDALEITQREVEVSLRGEYTRTFTFSGEMSAVGAIGFNNMYAVRGGLSFGKTSGDTDIKTFISGVYSPFSNLPLHFSVAYIYNGLPVYHTNTHTILPLVSFNAKRAGGSLGFNFRFTSFFNESAIFEPIISYKFYFNLINNEAMRVGIILGNISDFQARNVTAFSLTLNTVIRLDKKWAIVSDLELMQSGSGTASANFYGFSWRGGARYSW
jgi:hypothetical protein